MIPQPFTLRDGRAVLLRSIAPEDAERMIAFVNAVDTETRFLAREPGEFSMTADEARELLAAKLNDERALWLVAEAEGRSSLRSMCRRRAICVASATARCLRSRCAGRIGGRVLGGG